MATNVKPRPDDRLTRERSMRRAASSSRRLEAVATNCFAYERMLANECRPGEEKMPYPFDDNSLVMVKHQCAWGWEADFLGRQGRLCGAARRPIEGSYSGLSCKLRRAIPGGFIGTVNRASFGGAFCSSAEGARGGIAARLCRSIAGSAEPCLFGATDAIFTCAAPFFLSISIPVAYNSLRLTCALRKAGPAATFLEFRLRFDLAHYSSVNATEIGLV